MSLLTVQSPLYSTLFSTTPQKFGKIDNSTSTLYQDMQGNRYRRKKPQDLERQRHGPRANRKNCPAQSVLEHISGDIMVSSSIILKLPLC
jgi:hypothetical protein